LKNEFFFLKSKEISMFFKRILHSHFCYYIAVGQNKMSTFWNCFICFFRIVRFRQAVGVVTVQRYSFCLSKEGLVYHIIIDSQKGATEE